MPTVLQVGAYSFIFFSSDRGELVHIHVKRDRLLVKFWLNPISLAKNRGFKEHEINEIERLLTHVTWNDLARHTIYLGLQSINALKPIHSASVKPSLCKGFRTST